MSIISEVKCARCDRKYSGVRSRCPYCGARRIGRGKYSEEADNSKGKMLIGILIMSVLVIAVAVLLFTAPKAEVDENPGDIASPPSASMIPGEGDIVVESGTNPLTPTPTPTPTPEPTDESPSSQTVNSLVIMYGNKENNDFSEPVGKTIVLRVRIDPISYEGDIVWESSNRSVFEVVPTNPEKTQAKVTIVGTGTAKVTVTAGGVVDDCIVRGKKK